MARRCSSLAGAERSRILRQYHAIHSAAIEAEWASDLEKIKATAPAPSTFAVQTVSFPPPAQAASRVALSKSRIESPILRSAFLDPLLNHDQLDKATDDSKWTKIAALHAASSRLDDSSKALMRAKTPNPMPASRITESKRQIESPLLRALGNLERSIAEDTVRNEYLLHSRIHEWFAKGLPSDDVDKLNSRVYAELFLTPDSDPWLGLVPADTCTALENDGLLQSNNRPGDTSTRGLQPTIQP